MRSFGLRSALYLSSLCLAGGANIVFAALPVRGAEAAITSDGSFRSAAAAIRSALDAGDLALAEGRLSVLQADSATEKYVKASFRLELAAKRGDLRAQRSAIADMLTSGGAPADQLAYLNHTAGYLALQTGDSLAALQYLTQARSLGASSTQFLLLLADCQSRVSQPQQALQSIAQAFQQEEAAKRSLPNDWLDRAASIAARQKDWGMWSAFIARRLGNGAGPQEWRSAIMTPMTGASLALSSQLDLYRLQALAGAMASERDYEGYAAMAVAQGFPLEAKRIVDKGLANGKLLPGNPTIAGLMAKARPQLAAATSQANALKAKKPLASGGVTVLSSADKLFAAGHYAEAAAYYRQAPAAPLSVADRQRAQLRLGMSQLLAGDREAAQASFALADGAMQPVAILWTAWAQAMPGTGVKP